MSPAAVDAAAPNADHKRADDRIEPASPDNVKTAASTTTNPHPGPSRQQI